MKCVGWSADCLRFFWGYLDRKAGWDAAAIGFFGSCLRGKINYAADSEIYSSGGVGAVGCVVSGALGEWGDQGSVPVKIMGCSKDMSNGRISL